MQAKNHKTCAQDRDEHNFKTNEGVWRLKAYNNSVLEGVFVPYKSEKEDTSYAVIRKKNNEYQKGDFIYDKDIWVLGKIKIGYKNGNLQFLYNDKIFLEQNISKIEKKITNDKETTTYRQIQFNISNDEQLFGTGSRAFGSNINRRGKRLELYNKAHYAYEDNAPLMNFNIPFVLSSNNYAILFDNSQKGFLDLGASEKNTLSFECIGGTLRFYLIVGDNMQEVVENYTELTGKQPLLPRWAFGNFISRYGYHTETETRQTVEKMQKAKYPADAIILDHYWYGKGEVKKNVAMGDLDWFRPQFPTGEKMIQDFAKQNIKTILITQPFVLTNSKNYETTAQKGLLSTDKDGKPFIIKDIFWFGETTLLDIFNDNSRLWFWEQYKRLTLQGVGGWWGDLGEPEVHPSGIFHGNKTLKADEVHNVFGHYWAKTIAEGYKKDFANVRPFILMRAGFAGSQRFGMVPWSGDVHRAWGGLQAQVPISLNMGMAGMAYMHSDLGGFANDKYVPELYMRWLQYGVFQPIFRPHSQESVPSEPVFQPENVQKVIRKAIELRYSMIGYNYTLMWENHTKGTPLMRPTFFYANNDTEKTKILNNDQADTYFWGKNLLIAPVVKAGETQKTIYLPDNTQTWIDFYTKKTYKGGQNHTIDIKMDYIPVFVRGGAVLPMAFPDKKSWKSTQDYSSTHLVLDVFFDENKQNETSYLYHDDGNTPDAYAKGNYELLKFTTKKNGNDWEIILESEKGKNTAKNLVRDLHFHLYNLGEKNAKYKFLYNGKLISTEKHINWNGEKLVLKVVKGK